MFQRQSYRVQRTSKIGAWLLVFPLLILPCISVFAEQQFEFCNNFLMNISFITGTNRGMEQNLDDNFNWMQSQGYTHLRFFGIFPNHVHCFPSPTLDANGYPNSSYHEPVLELILTKALEHNIVINFDGWEVIAEANYDTIAAGVSYITAEELGAIVDEVLSLGVNLISEEQFGAGYIQEIQSVCSAAGADHETTASLWWQSSSASLIADMQLANVFSFYPYTQAEADASIAAGNPYSLQANLGALHPFLESCLYFNVPTSVAVGSFGTLEAENWANILRFVQIQHQPGRFSIEEQNTSFTIWDPGFNFMTYVGNDLNSFAEVPVGGRPIMNLIVNAAWIYTPSFLPAWYAMLINSAAVVNTFAADGYRVVVTLDYVLPGADAYYLLLAGGSASPNTADLPDYVMPLLEDDKVVFLQPSYGIPDENDGGGWTPLRDYFGLPPSDTETLADAIPEIITYNEYSVKWGGVKLYLTPFMERLRTTDINTSQVSVALSGAVGQDEVALILKHANKFLINSNLINMEAAYIFSSLISGTINRPAAADIVVANGKCLLFSEYDTEIDIDLPWSGNTRLTRYHPVGYSICDKDTVITGQYFATLSRGELTILINLDNFICGDADSDELINILDIVFLINYIYKNGPTPEEIESSDVNSDDAVNILDIVYLINYIYKSGPNPNCN